MRILFAVIATASLLMLHSARAESRLALVIGQSAYHSVPALPNPVRDARALAQVLTDAGFEVTSAFDVSEHQMRDKIGEFAGRVAIRGRNTVALVFYAGHGVQIDGENYLMPTDVDPKREADIPIQAIRLNDLLNALSSVPNKMRIVLLDACRNDPFPAINKTAGHGLALIDATIGVPGTFVSFSTSPGAEAADGSGAHSPYAAALLLAIKKEGISIEDLFKRVRVTVNKATGGRQTPWDSSSLTEDFEFAPSPEVGTGMAKQVVAKHTVNEWRRKLEGKPVDAANEIIVADGTEESYEAFIGLYAQPPFSLQAREWLDRHRRMVAWNKAVITNTAPGFRAFLAHYPDSDLTATARKLEERLRNRPSTAQAVAAAVSNAPVTSITPAGLQAAAAPARSSQPAPTCPCSGPPHRKSEWLPKKRSEANRPKWAGRATPPRPQNGSDYYSGGGSYGSGNSDGTGYGRSRY
jgi:hypothetical protein